MTRIIIFLAVPTPTVMLTSDPSGTVTVGSSITFTCAVELSAAVNTAVNVTPILTGPAGTIPLTPPLLSVATYTSIGQIASVSVSDDGTYTCSAVVTSASSFIFDSAAGSATLGVNVELGWCTK